ncbi:5-oxoprolinase subunit PxpB [Sporomusa acidovorans]|uniref:5-oxoprolinase subunit B n=1 Tax=Sporomusa acidovorans (strain ATCC 49682 / DSM 3132 / Mol) TaxID=1123286 RepID=A0ABZ3JA72_SPOA4|nr:5-oxoprolinase subunit PxpB [Sporomusa acidovorans]OZC16177.1 kinase A inhibitor [Sporomusa acidovorans DSM 3132]SDE29955.1 inhibitor of KinA [Sporomusa acidovorans]
MKQQPASAAPHYQLSPVGEAAIMVEFGKGIHPETNKKVKALADHLDQQPLPGMLEYVSAYSSVTVFFNPAQVQEFHKQQSDQQPGLLAYQIVAARLAEVLRSLDHSTVTTPRTVEIPVCYGGEYGPDLEYVAEHNKLTVEEVIETHCQGQYLVYMIGFAPGFPYLGGMSEKIATPRRSSPRLEIPAGSVGIAGMQTGVYPIATPGGWQLIGRTPLPLFRPRKEIPSLLQAGDLIRFRPVSPAEYEEYQEARP